MYKFVDSYFQMLIYIIPNRPAITAQQSFHLFSREQEVDSLTRFTCDFPEI
jgi:hypothetical protein